MYPLGLVDVFGLIQEYRPEWLFARRQTKPPLMDRKGGIVCITILGRCLVLLAQYRIDQDHRRGEWSSHTVQNDR